MPIVDATHDTPELVMLLVDTCLPADPLYVTREPHVTVSLTRDEASSFSVRSAAVHALRSGQLRNLPPDNPNYLTAAIKAAYQHRGKYRGGASLLNGNPYGPALRLTFVFRPGTDSDVTGRRSYRKSS